MNANGAEVIAGNYMIRYIFGAVGTAVVLPAIDSIGVGWFSTISAGFLVVSTLTTGCAVIWGSRWRENIDNERRAKRGKRAEEADELEREKNVTVSVMGKETV